MSYIELASLIKKELKKEVKILGVSKWQSIEKIEMLYAQGLSAFGENYVQEALPKLEKLKNLNIEWHFIGRIQKNKAKFIVGNFELIHSVDSEDLVLHLNKIAEEKKLNQKILLQINLSQESSKGGFREDQLALIMQRINSLKGLSVIGLMTMPPLRENPEEVRIYFRKLKEIQTSYQKAQGQFVELSMGTSHDYKVALEEGATIIRLGTLLFGERRATF